MAILYAFCCLGFAAVNDFVFKMFARKERSRGWFVAGAGMVWLLVLGFLPIDWQHSVGATLLCGAISGLFSVTANLLLIEAMGRQSAGVCSTIFRLNLVLVVIAACLWLGESINPAKIIGVGLAVVAIVAFVPPGVGRKSGMRTTAELGLFLALAACLLRAGMGLTYKWGFLRGADSNGVVVINSFFWIIGGILYAWLREKDPKINPKLVGYGIFSGVLISGIVLFMALALKYGNASVTLPIAQMSFLGTFGLSIIFFKEPVTWRKIVAVLCGVAAILLLVLG